MTSVQLLTLTLPLILRSPDRHSKIVLTLPLPLRLPLTLTLLPTPTLTLTLTQVGITSAQLLYGDDEAKAELASIFTRHLI